MSNKLTSTVRKSKENTVNIKPRRSKSKKQNIGLGIQPSCLRDCNYALSNNGTELVKLDLEHLVTGVTETFNFINGSAALDAVMDVLDPTGEMDIDFKDYIGTKMNVEIVESGKFRNIINAWALDEEQVEEDDVDEESDYEEDFSDEEDLEDEIDISDLLSGEDN